MVVPSAMERDLGIPIHKLTAVAGAQVPTHSKMNSFLLSGDEHGWSTLDQQK